MRKIVIRQKPADVDRRDFIKAASATGLGMMMTNRFPAIATTSRSPNEKVVMAVIGLNGRGQVHAQNFAKLPNSELAYLCDVDAKVLRRGEPGRL